MEILHSKIMGTGKPLLILHGFLGMSDNWKTLGSKYAEQGFEVHLLDQRNHGKSFHSPDFDYVILCQDVVNYIKHHHLDEINVLGHSMGGKTAMQLAISNPEIVSKLLVADIAPKFYPPHHQHIIDALIQLDFNHITSRKEADKQLSKHLSDFGIRQFLLKNLYWKDKSTLGFRFNLDVLKNKIEEIGENIDSTATYHGPTLFIRGDRSEYIMPNDFQIIIKNFPNAALETVDNAGHWLHAENPNQFFKKTLQFLNS
ncbi:alpha/beta fold hydrolase [Muricauda sp. JGD-17]|uniref:Alpha/beta fold hydrolase n=1 Tax=Flagellimonas ochracea TaxID=2696472 RepID=A0A964WXL7_9FLAO|nr:alpha/beta fold hydrolase [Allomuricauda ochracea]NAY92276.1 alpha/beta fold hydrolase [Allomuricauda ochracea]